MLKIASATSSLMLLTQCFMGSPRAQLTEDMYGQWELAVSLDFVEPSHTEYAPGERQQIRISADSLYVWGPGIPGEYAYAITWDGFEYSIDDFIPGEVPTIWPAASGCQPTVSGPFVETSWYPFPVELPCSPGDPCLRFTPVGCTDGGLWFYVKADEVGAEARSFSTVKGRY